MPIQLLLATGAFVNNFCSAFDLIKKIKKQVGNENTEMYRIEFMESRCDYEKSIEVALTEN